MFMRDPRKSRAIARLRDDQHRFWQGLTVPLGLGHGDYYVGNLLFEGPAGSASRRADALPSCSVSAILDWEGLSTDAPPGLDAVYLAITSQATFSEDNIGGVVAEVSMVGEEMANDLLAFGKPILVLGDPGQLPPIHGEGAFTNVAPDVMLDEIHRQAEGSAILRLPSRARRLRSWNSVSRISTSRASSSTASRWCAIAT